MGGCWEVTPCFAVPWVQSFYLGLQGENYPNPAPRKRTRCWGVFIAGLNQCKSSPQNHQGESILKTIWWLSRAEFSSGEVEHNGEVLPLQDKLGFLLRVIITAQMYEHVASSEVSDALIALQKASKNNLQPFHFQNGRDLV